MRSRPTESANLRLEINSHQEKEIVKKRRSHRLDIDQSANKVQRELTRNLGVSLEPTDIISRERLAREIGFLLWLAHFLIPDLSEQPLLPLIAQTEKKGDAWLKFIQKEGKITVLPEINFNLDSVREWLTAFREPDSIEELKARVQIYQLVGQEIGHFYLAKYQKPLERTLQANDRGVGGSAYQLDRGEQATQLFGDKFRKAAIKVYPLLFY